MNPGAAVRLRVEPIPRLQRRSSPQWPVVAPRVSHSALDHGVGTRHADKAVTDAFYPWVCAPIRILAKAPSH